MRARQFVLGSGLQQQPSSIGNKKVPLENKESIEMTSTLTATKIKDPKEKDLKTENEEKIFSLTDIEPKKRNDSTISQTSTTSHLAVNQRKPGEPIQILVGSAQQDPDEILQEDPIGIELKAIEEDTKIKGTEVN